MEEVAGDTKKSHSGHSNGMNSCNSGYGVLKELGQALGIKGSKKSNTKKTRKPPFTSARMKQKASSGLEPPASIAKAAFAIQRYNTFSAFGNRAVGQQAVNKPIS